MSRDDYETFCCVADSGGFTAAAKLLNRPKSTIGNAVARLEVSLSVRLLERTTRLICLTEAGESLCSHIKPLFAQLHDARNEAIAYISVYALFPTRRLVPAKVRVFLDSLAAY